MLYLAYGSNLNKKQMSRRCPNAKPVGSIILKGYKLEFRRVATIKHTKNIDAKIARFILDFTSKFPFHQNKLILKYSPGLFSNIPFSSSSSAIG